MPISKIESAVQHKLAYPIREAAVIAGVTPWTVHRSVTEGKLRARKLGKSWVILHADLAVFLDALPSVEPSTEWIKNRKKRAA